MEVEYILQIPDLVAFERFHGRQHSKAVQRIGSRIGMMVGLPLAAGMLLLQYLHLVPLLFSLLCMTVAWLFVVRAASLLLRGSLRAQLRQRTGDGGGGWHRLSIDPEGIVFATETSRYEAKWVRVRKIV